MEIKEKEFQVVKKPSEARQLRHKGHLIEDIKPKEGNREASVYIFRNTEDFRRDWDEIKKKNKK